MMGADALEMVQLGNRDPHTHEDAKGWNEAFQLAYAAFRSENKKSSILDFYEWVASATKERL